MKLTATTIPEMTAQTGIVFDRVRKTKKGVSFIKEYSDSFFRHMGEVARIVHLDGKYENVRYEALGLHKHSIKVDIS